MHFRIALRWYSLVIAFNHARLPKNMISTRIESISAMVEGLQMRLSYRRHEHLLRQARDRFAEGSLMAPWPRGVHFSKTSQIRGSMTRGEAQEELPFHVRHFLLSLEPLLWPLEK